MKNLAGLLAWSPDAVQGGDNEGGQTVYLFPSASAGLSRPLIDTISRFYGPDSDDHLTIILEDGTWLPASP